MTARREFAAAVVLCAVGGGLGLLSLRESWARVYYRAPAPLPSGSVPVTGWNMLPAAVALCLAGLACLAAVIATRGLVRRVTGVIMAVLGGWAAAVISAPVQAAGVVGAASGSGASGGLAGVLPGGNSAISGTPSTGGSLPVMGTATRVVLASAPWRAAGVAGAVLLIAAGLIVAWRGARWPVMSARFDRPGPQPVQRGTAAQRTPGPALGAPGQVVGRDQAGQPVHPDQTGLRHPDGEAAALWEALDRGLDLTEPDVAEPEMAGTDSAGSDPAGSDPAGSDPAGSDPAGSDPAGTAPADPGPADRPSTDPEDPASTDPAGQPVAARRDEQ